MENLIGLSLDEQIKDRLEKRALEGEKYISQRTQAFENFKRQGFPTKKNEDWRYTNVGMALNKNYSTTFHDVTLTEDYKKYLYSNLQGNILLFINGIFHKDLSSILEEETHLEIHSLETISENKAEEYLFKNVLINDGLTSLNTAAFDDVLFLRCKKGKALTHPVYCYFINTGNNDIFNQPRLHVVAEEKSTMELIEIHIKNGQQSFFSNSYTEIILQKDSIVNYCKIIPESSNFHHVGTTQVNHEAVSTFNGTTLSFGNTFLRNNTNVLLNASHCHSTINGLYLTNDKQHVDNHTLVDHAMPHCKSSELYKGILNGKSTGVFNGKIYVRKDAQKTNAFQSNKNILLSKDATINTKPQLEIFADDVKCSHGTTVGQIDSESLFYLRSRGLSEESAKKLLVSAFAEDIISQIKINSLKDLLENMLSQTLSLEI